jgi:Flp pilus assembly protein TadB
MIWWFEELERWELRRWSMVVAGLSKSELGIGAGVPLKGWRFIGRKTREFSESWPRSAKSMSRRVVESEHDSIGIGRWKRSGEVGSIENMDRKGAGVAVVAAVEEAVVVVAVLVVVVVVVVVVAVAVVVVVVVVVMAVVVVGKGMEPEAEEAVSSVEGSTKVTRSPTS